MKSVLLLMLILSASSSADWQDLYRGLPWKGPPQPPHRFKIVTDVCPEVFTALAPGKVVEIGRIEDIYIYLKNNYAVTEASEEPFNIEINGIRLIVSRVLTKRDRELITTGLQTIPHPESLFFRILFDNQEVFESEIVGIGNERGTNLHPFHIVSSCNEIVQKRLAEGHRIVKFEIIHPHLVEPLYFVRKDKMTQDLIAFPDGYDLQVPAIIHSWFNGNIVLFHEDGTVSHTPLKHAQTVVNKYGIEQTYVDYLRTLQQWEAATAKFRSTVILGVDQDKLISISYDH